MESRFKALGWAYIVSGVLSIILTLFLSSQIQQLAGLISESGFPGVGGFGGPSLGLEMSSHASFVGAFFLILLAVVLAVLAISRGYSAFTRLILVVATIIVIALAVANIGTPGVLSILLLLALAVLLMINGYGILVRRPWAQPLTVALSVILFFAKPIGTAIAVFGLWVMALPVVTTQWDHYTSDVRSESASRSGNSPEA